MKIQGSLLKMTTVLNDPVDYFLVFDDQKIHMNDLINKKVSIAYLDEIHCIRCGRKTNKSFQQGYCFPCLRTAPETDDCILRPEMLVHQKYI